MEVTTENTMALTKMCRACLSRDEPFLEIFNCNCTSSNEILTLCEMFVAVACIKVQLGDGLPDVICQNCAEKVNAAHNFKALCKQSDDFLRVAATDSGLNIKTEESSQDHICFVKVENASEEETDCLDTSLSGKSDGSMLMNALTSTKPKLILSNTLTQDLNPIDTGQSTYQVKIKEEPTSDSGIEPIMSNPNTKLSGIKTIKAKNLKKANKKPSNDFEIKNLSRKNTKKSNISKSSENLKIEEKSDNSSEEDKILPSPVKPKKFTCYICSQTFNRRSELIAHKKTHPADMKHQCPHCDKHYFNIYSLRNHVITHSDTKAHVCTICAKGFHLLDGLRKHMKHHKGIRPHACQFCEKRFYAPNAMREHMRYAHSDDKYGAICNVCGKKFTTKNALIYHMTTHTGERPFACDQCGKRFSVKRNLKNHKWRHSDQGVMCEYEDCGRKLSSKSALQVHIKHKHSTERPFSCNLCTKAFATKAGLNEHLMVHTGEKPEVCSICDSKFVSKQSLKKHMRLHTGERPYCCPHCDETFICSSRVKAHIQRMHMERSQECLECGKMFHLRTTLISHMRVHRGIKRNRRKKVPPPEFVEVKQIVPEEDSAVIA